MLRICGILLALVIVGAATGIGYLHWASEQPVKSGATFTIKPGDGVSAIAQDLVDAGLINEPYSFIFWSHLKDYTRSLKAGEYEIEPGVSLIGLLDQFVEGDVITYSVTLIEGWTFRQFLAALNAHDKLVHDIGEKTDQEIMAAVGFPDLHPEGRFFPDTYVFDANTSELDVLRQAIARMNSILEQEWQNRDPDIELKTPEEALVMASIIEKETGKPEERETISAVFSNRLQKNMRLQTDPTVIYGLGDSFDGNLKRSHLKQDNPYNTYTRFGLPPTPIANPGADAIRAALHPEESEFLYFVSRGDGSHQFSRTLDEHNSAVVKYQLGGKSKPVSSNDE